MSNLMTELEDGQELVSVDNSYWAGLNDALISLKTKHEYKNLIESGYLSDYVNELVQELINPNVINNNLRSKVIEKLVAVARFKDYLQLVQAMCYRTEESNEMLEQEEELKYRNRVLELTSMLERLEKDKDFEVLITKGYLNNYAVSQTSLLANENALRNASRHDMFEALLGISNLQNYLIDVHRNGHVQQDTDEE